jgi:hypothetical protein
MKETLANYFESLEDHRLLRNQRHRFNHNDNAAENLDMLT